MEVHRAQKRMWQELIQTDREGQNINVNLRFCLTYIIITAGKLWHSYTLQLDLGVVIKQGRNKVFWFDWSFLVLMYMTL